MSDEPIDETNRFVIVVLALLLIFASLLVVLLAWAATSSSIDRISDLAGYLRRHGGRDDKLILTLGALVVVLLMMTVIILELTPSPMQRMRLRTVTAGDASLTTRDIAARVEAEVRAVPHVSDCTAVVAAHGHRVEVALDLHVDPGANLADTADAACARTQSFVERQMGVPLSKPPRARLHYRELRLRDDARTAPAASDAAASGWERPATVDEGERERRDQPDAPEEAQA